MDSSGPTLLPQLALLSDLAKTRVLCALERQELTVSELCLVLRQPQSTVSRLLKQLGDQGWLARRREGTRAFYALDTETLGPAERRVWLLVREQVHDLPACAKDRARLARVLQQRRGRSSLFFAQAEQWQQVRHELYGERFDLHALLGLLDPEWSYGDLGCGGGDIAAALAPFVARVVAVDRSAAMLEAARVRLDGLANVELRSGELERLPVGDGELDAAGLLLVLHHVAEPLAVVREAARVLRPGGRLLVVDMLAHEREELRSQLGHVWLGFAPAQVDRLFANAGFEAVRCNPLPPAPEARGPRLFVASAGLPRVAAPTAEIRSRSRVTNQHKEST